MTITSNDREILRALARRVAIIASDPVNQERVERSVAMHALKPGRPLVWVDEIPWHEMNFDDHLALRCEGEDARSIETQFRRTIMRWDFFQADMVVRPFYTVLKAYEDSGIGVKIDEYTRATDERNNIISHHYVDQLDTPDKVDALKCPVIEANPELDDQRVETLTGIFGDILPIELRGHGIYYAPWDTIGMLRGVTNCLIDMVERPELIRQTIARFTQILTSRYEQFERLGLLEARQDSLHCTPPYTDSTPAPDWDGGPYRFKDVWFRGMAQLFSSVSPEMHQQFDLEYMRPMMERCALTYYGCCEPLDRVIPYLKKIKNMRKLGVTPWANVRSCAEQIGGDYVLARKPNPAQVAGALNEQAIRADIRETITACLDNGCPYEFTLKDISTVGYNPKNLIDWVRIVEDELDKYYK